MSVSECFQDGITPDETEFYRQFRPDNKYLGQAMAWAIVAHRGQTRKSGGPYVEHPIAVLQILRSWGIQKVGILAAGILHDTVEDSETTLEDIRQRWGPRVATWVDGVSNLKTDLETHQKTATQTVVDPVNGTIKLADRVHNMRTLDAMPQEKQVTKALETRHVHCELADGLGMWLVREELFDLAFRYAEPNLYARMEAEIAADARTSEVLYGHLSSKVELLLSRAKIKGEVGVRFKGCYSTHMKRERLVYAGKCRPDSLDGLNDLISLGVVVESREDCYRVLNQLHNVWDGRVLVDEFKDRIANPSDNGYQALQITIMTPSGPVEIAVMTREMHEFNDWGIVSKIRRGRDINGFSLKPVFSHHGRVLFMPMQSTGIDLMARQNPALMRRNPTMLINDVPAPVSTVIPVGSRVSFQTTTEIPTSVDEAWMAYCTPASQRVLQELIVGDREAAIVEKGKQLITGEIAHRGLLLLSDLGEAWVERIVQAVDGQEGRVNNLNQLQYLLGGGYIKLEKLTTALDALGVTKDGLQLSTLEVKGGRDQPGILKLLAASIEQHGGNIKSVYPEAEGDFTVRITVHKLANPAGLHAELADCPLFSSVVLV